MPKLQEMTKLKNANLVRYIYNHNFEFLRFKKKSFIKKELEKALNNVTNELNETKNLVAALKLENEEMKVNLFKIN